MAIFLILWLWEHADLGSSAGGGATLVGTSGHGGAAASLDRRRQERRRVRLGLGPTTLPEKRRPNPARPRGGLWAGSPGDGRTAGWSLLPHALHPRRPAERILLFPLHWWEGGGEQRPSPGDAPPPPGRPRFPGRGWGEA